jgi:hypothetical protein
MNKRHPLDELFKQQLGNASAPVADYMWARIAQVRRERRQRRLILFSGLTSIAAVGLVVTLLMQPQPLLQHFPMANTTEEIAAAQPWSNSGTALSPMTAIKPIPVAPKKTKSPAVAIPATTPVSKSLATREKTAGSSAKAIAKKQVEQLVVVPELERIAAASPVVVVPIIGESESETNKIAGPHQRERNHTVTLLPGKAVALDNIADVRLFASHSPRCASFTNPFFHFDAELLTGPAYAQQVLRAKTTESSNHLQLREKSESAGVSYTIGARIAAMTNTGLGFRTGVQFTQINDRFKFQVGSRMDVSTLFGPNGEIVGQDTVYTDAYEESRTNKMKFVEIPLLLSYEKQVGKVRVGAHAGAFLNLYFDTEGAIYSPATEMPIAIGQMGDRDVLPIFNQKATASWYGGLSVAYNLHSRYSLLAEPYFKAYPRTLSTEDYVLQQSYWMVGLQVGLRMRL